MPDFRQFEQRVGYAFKDATLLKQAFTHRSYLNENKHHDVEHNERLEFLGDAVLELVATTFLFRAYPDKPEGDLTSYRAALVNTQSISDAASNLGMNDFLLLSKGEAKDTGRARQYILANWLLELSLVIIAIFTIYEEAKGPNEKVGKGFVIFFTVIQLLVFALIMIGLTIDIVKWCYSRQKKRKEVYKVKEINE
jgi:hypothetical protein